MILNSLTEIDAAYDPKTQAQSLALRLFSCISPIVRLSWDLESAIEFDPTLLIQYGGVIETCIKGIDRVVAFHSLSHIQA